jgi:hypothetical protein
MQIRDLSSNEITVADASAATVGPEVGRTDFKVQLPPHSYRVFSLR